jgi:hypothetical protein
MAEDLCAYLRKLLPAMPRKAFDRNMDQMLADRGQELKGGALASAYRRASR